MEITRLIEATAEYLKLHPHLSCIILFTWSFLETALLLGLLLPAEKVLIISSVLASEGIISPISFLTCITTGTFLGYTVSYFMGTFLGKALLYKTLKKLGVSEEGIRKTQEFIEKRGEISLIFGRFLPVVRATLPVVIGSFKPNFAKFSLYNLIGAFLWALSYLFLGNLIKEVFSLIITHKFVAIPLSLACMAIYLFWRKYGKNRKLF